MMETVIIVANMMSILVNHIRNNIRVPKKSKPAYCLKTILLLCLISYLRLTINITNSQIIPPVENEKITSSGPISKGTILLGFQYSGTKPIDVREVGAERIPLRVTDRLNLNGTIDTPMANTRRIRRLNIKYGNTPGRFILNRSFTVYHS